MTTQTRIKLLNHIFEHFQQCTQWVPNNYNRASEYSKKAEALIDFIEVQDCDRIGGFDCKNPIKRTTGYELYDRFLTLVRKYKNETDIENSCYFNLQSLGTYFSMLSKLREQFNK